MSNNLIENIKELLYSTDPRSKPLALEIMKAMELTWEHPQFKAEKELINWLGIDIFGKKQLELGNKQLQSLPSTICRIQSLEELYLYSNQLQSLPSSFGQLSCLKYLSLSNNQLQSSIDSISPLQNLKWLDLRNNQLKSVETKQLSKILPHTKILL